MADEVHALPLVAAAASLLSKEGPYDLSFDDIIALSEDHHCRENNADHWIKRRNPHAHTY